MESGSRGGPAAAAAGAAARGCCCGGCRCSDCPKDFQKVLELRDVGLVVYRHTARTEERNKISGLLESATDTTDDVYILMNTKSAGLTSAQHQPGVETTKISCPRCRKLAERVRNMLQRAPSSERKPVSGICDRCLMRGDACYNCERMLNKFLSQRRAISEGTKTLIRQWLSKIQHMIEDMTGLDDAGAGVGGTLHSDRIRASSELYIDQIFMKSQKGSRQLDIKPLFRPRAIRLDERGQFVEDPSRFQDSDVSSLFDHSGEKTGRPERERGLDGRPRQRQPDALRDRLWTRRSHSQESISSFAKASKGEAARRESHRFQEGEYKRRGEGKHFTEADDYRDQGEVSETYARGDAHHKPLTTVRSRSTAPVRRGTRAGTSAASDLAQGDDTSIDDFGKGRARRGAPSHVEGTAGIGERAERKHDKYIEHDSIDRFKIEKDEQKHRDKNETDTTKPYQSELTQQDRQRLKSEKDKRAKESSGLELKQKEEKEYSSKDKGRLEQKEKGEKELGTKNKGGQESIQKGEKEYSTKDKGGQEQKQKGDKGFTTKDKGGQESKQKGEKEYSTKDQGGQEQKQKSEKDFFTKEKGKGGQEPKQKEKGEKEYSTKDQGGQEQKQKSEKDFFTKEKGKGGQEPKQKEKGEKEYSTKDKDGREQKQRGEKELVTKDKGGQELKHKRVKELNTKEKAIQIPPLKGEKELSTKDIGGLEPKQRGEKELRTKDKAGGVQKPKEVKELGPKEKDGKELKQKEEKEFSAKDKGGPEHKEKVDRELRGKDQGRQELKQKGKTEEDKALSDTKLKEKVGKESKFKDKEAPERIKKSKDVKEGEISQGPKPKGTGDKDMGETSKAEKESDSKNKGGADTTNKGKGEKEWGTKERDEESKQKETGSKDMEKQQRTSTLTILMEQKRKEQKFKDNTVPRDRGERQRGRKDENEAEDRILKGRKKDKKREESKKSEDKKDKEFKKKKSIEEQKEIAVKEIRVRRASPDDLILRLVKLKQSETPTRKYRDVDIKADIEQIIRRHFDMDHEGDEAHLCPFCCDSEYGLDAPVPATEPEYAEVIIGAKVYKYKLPHLPTVRDPNGLQDTIVPLQFKSTFKVENIVQTVTPPPMEDGPPLPLAGSIQDRRDNKKLGRPSRAQGTDPICTKGITHFQLSDRSFIDKGWTMLPTEKVVRKMNVYRMRPAHPEFDWFQRNRRKRLMDYESGERLAEFDEEGRGRWFYRNGRLALDYYDAEGLNAQQRFVIYSSGEADGRGRAQPYTILATFDYLGNGIVFDHTGKIRLKYNQTEGVVLDRSIGPVSHWKWHALNDPPVLAQVMIDTQEPHQDPRLAALRGAGGDARPPRPGDHDDMVAIELDNFARTKSEKLAQAFKPFQIKMKALKINEYFSLKVLDQATVHLIYRDGSTNLKLNLGMVLEHREIVDTDLAEPGEVSSELERLPARSESVAALQRGVRAAQRWGRRREARERRLRPAPPPLASADRLAAAATAPRPYAPPPPPSGPCRCTRKPTGPNLYYDNRIF